MGTIFKGVALIAVTLLAGCAVPSGGSGGSGGPSDSDGAAGSSDGSQSDEPTGPPPPSQDDLTRLAWTDNGTVIIGDFQLASFEGTYTIQGDEGVIVTVMGPSVAAVEAFTSDARFSFELAPSLEEVDSPPEPDPDELRRGDLSDPSNPSLLIDFRPTDAAIRAQPSGSLIGVIDPTVPATKYNNFSVRDPANDAYTRDTASITVWVSGGPGVELRLYRQCSRVGTLVKTPSNVGSTLSRTGIGKFDLVVYGLGSGAQTSRYQLRGTWAYDYTAALSPAPSPLITC